VDSGVGDGCAGIRDCAAVYVMVAMVLVLLLVFAVFCEAQTSSDACASNVAGVFCLSCRP
jgi:hypothetical protein